MTRRMRKTRLQATAVLALSVAPVTASDAVAQDPSQLVEGVVAIVGDSVILWTELQEFVFELQATGYPVPEETEEFRSFLAEALDQKVNEALLSIHARREGVVVSQGEIDDQVEDRLADIRRRFPSELEFQNALVAQGTTLPEFRIRMTDRVRVVLTTQRYLQQKVGQMQPLPVSEAEIRERFEQQRSALGPRPATVSLQQVVVATRPSEEARLEADELAARVLSRARTGEDFARLAREFSEDPGSQDRGGDLGWVRPGQLLPEFEETLFAMRAGEISDLVETAAGTHIIKLERIRGPERLARHILIRPELTDADAEVARQTAETAAAALRDGADPDSLIALYGDPTEQAVLTRFPRDRMPPTYAEALAQAVEGEVIGPFLVESPGTVGRGKWVTALVTELNPSGEYTLDDVRETFRMQIQQERMLQKVVADLREVTYVETRLDRFPLTQ